MPPIGTQDLHSALDGLLESPRTAVPRTNALVHVHSAAIIHAGALDEAINAIPSDWFRASAAIYWCDLFASASVGWLALAAAVRSSSVIRVALLAVAVAALYRAVLFIHEITHRAGRDVPMFKFVWNATVGVPLLLPSFLYEAVH